MPIPEGTHTCTTCRGEGYTRTPPTLWERFCSWFDHRDFQNVDTTPIRKEKHVYINRKKDTSLTATILAFLLFPLSIILGGFVLTKLWAWFAVPVFPGLPLLTTGQGVGLNCLLGFAKVGLATTVWDKDDGEEMPLAVKLFGYCVVYVVALIGGYVVHLVIS